jgi:hypothetical protein
VSMVGCVAASAAAAPVVLSLTAGATLTTAAGAAGRFAAALAALGADFPDGGAGAALGTGLTAEAEAVAAGLERTDEGAAYTGLTSQRVREDARSHDTTPHNITTVPHQSSATATYFNTHLAHTHLEHTRTHAHTHTRTHTSTHTHAHTPPHLDWRNCGRNGCRRRLLLTPLLLALQRLLPALKPLAQGGGQCRLRATIEAHTRRVAGQLLQRRAQPRGNHGCQYDQSITRRLRSTEVKGGEHRRSATQQSSPRNLKKCSKQL